MRMENHVMMEVEVQGLTLRKEVPDAWSGGNPLYHAKEARRVMDQVADELDALIASHYGDIRGREFNAGERLEAKNVRVDPGVWAKASKQAADEGTNISAVVRKLVANWVG